MINDSWDKKIKMDSKNGKKSIELKHLSKFLDKISFGIPVLSFPNTK